MPGKPTTAVPTPWRLRCASGRTLETVAMWMLSLALFTTTLPIPTATAQETTAAGSTMPVSSTAAASGSSSTPGDGSATMAPTSVNSVETKTDTGSVRAAPTDRAQDASTPLSSIPAQVIYLPNARGELVAVPAGASIEKFLEWLQLSRKPVADGVPPLAISAVEITGSSNDERASLNVRLTIQIQPATEFVRVPISLAELVVVESSYSGPGRALFGGTERDGSLVWWLSGRGEHVLELNGTVPLRRQGNQRRLSLSVPEAAINHATLDVGAGEVLAKAAEPASVRVDAVDVSHTRLDLFGFRSRCDVTWQAVLPEDAAETAIEVGTTMLARLAPNTALLEVTQRIQALQGTFERIPVELPPGAELLRLEGRDYKDHTITPGSVPTVQVRLTAPTSGPITLRWVLRLPLGSEAPHRLSGFTVPGARRQSGEIGLIPFEGYRIVMTDLVDQSLIRINAGELRPLAPQATVTRAYRFLAQPFNLPFTLEAIEPYFTVDPEFHLLAAADQLQLEAHYHAQVFRGALSELSMEWPGWQSDGWIIESIEPRGQVISEFSVSSSNPDIVQLELVGVQSDTFDFVMRARRSLKQESDLSLTLPRFRTSASSPAPIVVYDAENVASDLTAADETILRPLPAPARARLAVPEAWRDFRRHEFRIDTEERRCALHLEQRARQVRVRSQSQVLVQEFGASGTQVLEYSVEYERLGQVRLLVPSQLPVAGLRITDEAGQELVPEFAGDEAGPAQLIRVPLAAPKLGVMRLTIQSNLQLPAGQVGSLSGSLEVPLIHDADYPIERCDLQVDTPPWIEPLLASRDWQPSGSADRRAQWRAVGGAPNQVELRLQPVRQVGAAAGILSKAWTMAWVDVSGLAQLQSTLAITSAPASLVVELPPKCEVVQFLVAGAPLPAASIAEIVPGSRRFALRLPEAADSSCLLTVNYQMRAGDPLRWWNDLELAAPDLPQCVLTAQVIWHVYLPGDQHLWIPPRSATPLYHWERQGWFWSRVTEPRPQEASRWIGPQLGAVPGSDIPGNLYGFGQIGAPRAIKIQTLSAPMVVLFGAGLSLVCGFLMLRMRWMRHPLTWLSGAAVMATVSLWYLPAIELLLQPMLVGLLLPLCALALDRWNRPKEAPAILTLGLGSAQPNPPSSMLRTQDYPGTPPFDEEPTLLRRPGNAPVYESLPEASGVSQ